MEFIMIGEDKIKVTLTEEDLSEFELCADELDYSNTETKRMFWDVLSRAKARTGFDTDGQRVLVQLYPSKDGGCEIFVTKIGSIYKDIGEERADSPAPPTFAESAPPKRKMKASAPQMARCAVYSFSSLEDMIRVCRELARRGYEEESLAYISDTHVFYLVLHGILDELGVLSESYRFISEFGESENAKAANQILREHADAIASPKAVSALALC